MIAFATSTAVQVKNDFLSDRRLTWELGDYATNWGGSPHFTDQMVTLGYSFPDGSYLGSAKGYPSHIINSSITPNGLIGK